MKRLFLRIIILTLTTSLLGGFLYYQTDMELALGLDTLFKIRGKRPAPEQVVVVAMDEPSETHLGVSYNLTAWRGFHAKLVQELTRQGAALIVFDLQFIKSQPDYDTAFAEAIRKAGNVLVTDCVIRLDFAHKVFSGREQCSEANSKPTTATNDGQSQPITTIKMNQFPATPVLADAILDHAPFFLSDIPDDPSVREAWLFSIISLKEIPLLPVVVWLNYLQYTNTLQGIVQPKQPFSNWLSTQRTACLASPFTIKTHEPKQSALEKHIYDVICSEDDSRYLDFYGPAKTLHIESYKDVYEGKVTDLKGKVVFIGKANQFLGGKITDVFQSPFTDKQTGRMFGVEIMATQFANLLERRFIESPCPPLLLLITFGLIISVLLSRIAGFTGIAASLLFSTGYVSLAMWIFARNAIWLPVAIPLLVQLPLAWLLTLLWSRRDLLKERKRILDFIRRVFPGWLHLVPASPGLWNPSESILQPGSGRDVYGLCLATDIKGYTQVAANHTAHEMWDLLSAYYHVLGQPVSTNNGVIANIQGDAMLALWTDLPPDVQRLSACLAALEIGLAVDQFNESSNEGRLPTRIGLHQGNMILASGEAGDFRFYNPFGDAVNTASRIEGVNKLLGTQILASAAVVAQLTQISHRPVGLFRLVGLEDTALDIVEIVGMASSISLTKQAMHKQFASGLAAFQNGNWEDAIICFQSLLETYGKDGPAKYYFNLSKIYNEKPPLTWDGVVTLKEK